MLTQYLFLTVTVGLLVVKKTVFFGCEGWRILASWPLVLAIRKVCAATYCTVPLLLCLTFPRVSRCVLHFV